MNSSNCMVTHPSATCSRSRTVSDQGKKAVKKNDSHKSPGKLRHSWKLNHFDKAMVCVPSN
jgi:hypothetical protein